MSQRLHFLGMMVADTLGACGGPVAPLLLPDVDRQAAWLDAWQSFRALLLEPRFRLEIAVEAGQLVAFDNWRVLHGRRAFQGARRFQGFYLNREDFESRLRVGRGGLARGD